MNIKQLVKCTEICGYVFVIRLRKGYIPELFRVVVFIVGVLDIKWYELEKISLNVYASTGDIADSICKYGIYFSIRSSCIISRVRY